MNKVVLYEFQLRRIAEALRLSSRALGSKKLESSMHRDIEQAKQYVKNAMEGNIDIHVSRLNPNKEVNA